MRLLIFIQTIKIGKNVQIAVLGILFISIIFAPMLGKRLISLLAALCAALPAAAQFYTMGADPGGLRWNYVETPTYRVQELHLPVYHWLCAKLEESFFEE